VRNRKTEWSWGDKTRIAKLAGISPQYLNKILYPPPSEARACHVRLAKDLVRASRALGYDIAIEEWVWVAARRSPLFTR
jgi:hypothetical protein